MSAANDRTTAHPATMAGVCRLTSPTGRHRGAWSATNARPIPTSTPDGLGFLGDDVKPAATSRAIQATTGAPA